MRNFFIHFLKLILFKQKTKRFRVKYVKSISLPYLEDNFLSYEGRKEIRAYVSKRFICLDEFTQFPEILKIFFQEENMFRVPTAISSWEYFKERFEKGYISMALKSDNLEYLIQCEDIKKQEKNKLIFKAVIEVEEV